MLPDPFRFVAFCVKAHERERERRAGEEGVASEYVGVVVYGEPQFD